MSAYSDAVNADSPAYYWRMKDPSGTVAEENGGTGITMSGVTYGVTGPLAAGDEGAISFDGSNDYGQVALSLSTTNTITIEYWLKWDVNGTTDDVSFEYSANANSNNGFNFIHDNSTGGVEANTISCKNHNGTNDRRWTIPRPSAGVWHHYVWIFDRSIAQWTPTVYVDGVAVTATLRGSNNNCAGNFSNTTLNVMSRNKASLFGAGDLAHVAIWKSALTKTQVEAHYDARDDAGLAPVSATRDIEYDIIAAVSAARSVKYNIIAAVSEARDVIYDIVKLVEVSAGRDVIYDVIAQVAEQRSVSYDISAGVSSSRNVAYDIIATVAEERELIYDVLNLVADERTIDYDIIAAVLASRGVIYDVRVATSDQRDIVYDVLQVVSQTRGVEYDMLNALSRDRDIIYDGLVSVSADRTIRYRIGDEQPAGPNAPIRPRTGYGR